VAPAPLAHRLTLVLISSLIFTALVVLQVGLILTGGAVRLTGSGLGCPTWPRCTPGSFKPIPHQVQGQLHAWIEFTNRLLTFVLFFVALAALIGAFKWGKSRLEYRRIRALAILQILGILGQGVLGGITVLTHLNPIPVAGHFLLTVALIAGSVSLRALMAGKIKVEITRMSFRLSRGLAGLTLLVIVLGTIVTGSGPHAGDIKARRFGIDPRTISWIHADAVIALISLTLGLLLIVKVSESVQAKTVFGKQLRLFLIVSLAQGTIGYIQYFTKLPELIVATHLLGSGLVWVAMWNLIARSKEEAAKSHTETD